MNRKIQYGKDMNANNLICTVNTILIKIENNGT